jgi:hypothetical protein
MYRMQYQMYSSSKGSSSYSSSAGILKASFFFSSFLAGDPD